jgi:hypothetical protein
MTNKTLLRTMALIAAAGGAVAFLMPFLDRSEKQAPGKRRRAARRTNVVPLAKPAATGTPEKAARAPRARRPGTGGSPSHH